MKLNRIAAGLVIACLPLATQANQSLVSPGYSASIGGVSNRGSVHSSSHNPAVNRVLIKEGDRFRMGYLSNIGGYIELGDADDLLDELDELVDDLDAADEITDNFTPQRLIDRYGPGLTEVQYYEEIAERINTQTLSKLEKGGSISFGGQVQAPLTPFLFNSELARGTFSLNASASVQARLNFIGSPFGVRTTIAGAGDLNIPLGGDLKGVYDEIDGIINNSQLSKQDQVSEVRQILESRQGLATQENIATLDNMQSDPNNLNFDDAEFDLVTDSGMQGRYAVVAHLGLGYGASMTDLFDLDRSWGEFDAGVRFNYYQVEAGRSFYSLQADADADDDDDIFDDFVDQLKDETNTNNLIGLDLGMLWHRGNYQAGITFYNLNEPEVSYSDMSGFLNGKTLDAAQRLEGEGKLSLDDKVTLTRHAVIEGSWMTRNQRWTLNGYATLGTATNFVGDEYRNVGVSAAYNSGGWFLPGLRAGYNKNLAGTELSSINLGGTFFGILNADVAFSTETNSFDGTDVPRYLAFSLGFEERF